RSPATRPPVYPPCSCLTSHVYRRYLLSFPTRRSSDLGQLLDVHRGEAIFFHHALGNEHGILEVVAVPGHEGHHQVLPQGQNLMVDRKSTRLNSSHVSISYAVFCLQKKKSTSTLPSRMS